MTASRQARLESMLHREIATTIQSELKDPRLGFITVTRVVMTADLHQVKAYYTVLGDAKARKLAGDALTNATGYVQRQYAPYLKTRLVPILTFVYDEAEKKRDDIDSLIRKARSTDADRGANPEPASAEVQARESLKIPPIRPTPETPDEA